MNSRHRTGEAIADLCRACKAERSHTVMAVDGDGRVLRVVCGFCGSQHNYRGGGDSSAAPRARARVEGDPLPLVSEHERALPTMSLSDAGDIEMLLRRVIREEAGVTPVIPASKWRGGQLVLRPGNASLQEKVWPIDALFHKIVMIRNRLRTMEQQINASELPEDQKLKLQAYLTACYGSLTSFNVLFADEEDQFAGAGGEA